MTDDANEKLNKELGTIMVKVWHAKNLRLSSEIKDYSRDSVEQIPAALCSSIRDC